MSNETRSLSTQLAERGIEPSQWHTLSKSLFPGARAESVLLAIDYCRARKLDPMKKPCHIVPLYVRDAATGKSEMRDVILPGIYELRTTAHRTGEYGGHSMPEYGPVVEFAGVSAPEWCQMTAYRRFRSSSLAEFPVRTYFTEVVATNRDGKANARWARAPIQMLTKCCESAALREAFPDEIGGQHTEEEMHGQPAINAPAQYESGPRERPAPPEVVQGPAIAPPPDVGGAKDAAEPDPEAHADHREWLDAYDAPTEETTDEE